MKPCAFILCVFLCFSLVELLNLQDNAFLRQYELTVDGEMATLEYSQQERKIFLTKLNIPRVYASNERNATNRWRWRYVWNGEYA